MRQFNYMPLGLVRVVELPLQLLLAPRTSKKQHKFFVMSLFPWACNSLSNIEGHIRYIYMAFIL